MESITSFMYSLFTRRKQGVFEKKKHHSSYPSKIWDDIPKQYKTRVKGLV